jgi:cytochrome c oxidase cbb3-type subunit 3
MLVARVALLAAFTVLSVASFAAAGQQPQTPQTDPDAVQRGRQLHVAECGFCHGPNARGASGPDLTRSELVQTDENGKQLGAFVRVGRPERGMPKFDLSDRQIADLAAFLHAEIYLAANRRLYKILDILTGNPKAGEAFFNGAGGCRTCHSPTGDLKGVGAKYTDPATLQGRMVLPRSAPPGAPPMPSYRLPNALRVTVTSSSGEVVTGTLVRLTDFDVTLFDPASGAMRSWLRNGDTPRVSLLDPLQAHVDMLFKWTDADMHNVTAFLATLK